MSTINQLSNPFPGLRPFESTETHLFFGRDGQSSELIRRLKRTRFLAVVGTSGSGKSSLVRAGLLPALQGGLMASAGSDWRIAIMRPGVNPIGNLANSLATSNVLGTGDETQAEMQAALAETTLRRSSLGLIELVRRARKKLDNNGQPLFHDYENLLVVVDQFEELFRFKQLIEDENSTEDAAAFVKLLLEAVRQQDEKIYVVLTMRSDFLGDCAQFFELPEAINDGQYLIPRMTRDERREAITGPVAVGHGAMTEPLVNQLLNDVGDNPDQLPILQHALMRTWDYWLGHRRNGEAIDLDDYNAIGGMAEALSLHADEAYEELNAEQKVIAEKLFKGLTEKGADNREIRRPMELQEICKVTNASEAEVIAVIEVFRRKGRSFLMPPPTDPLTGAAIPLTGESLIDISHESLIRNWKRLKTWVDEESRSARIYRRLAETAVLHKEGGAGLWRDPDLSIALVWREESQPNEVWAQRYHTEFPLAMNFLDESVAARDAQLASEEARRKKEINRTRLTALVCVLGFLISTGMGVFAYGRKLQAEKAREETKGALERAKQERDNAQQAQQEANRQRILAEGAKQDATKQKDVAVAAQTEANDRAEDAKKSAEAAEKSRLAAVSAQNDAKRNAEAEKEARIAADEAQGMANRNAVKAQDRETLALVAVKTAIAKVGENRRLLYSSDMGIAQTAFEENNSARAQELLNRYTNNTTKPFLLVGDKKFEYDTEDLRGFEWYYLWGLANRKLDTLQLAGDTAAAKADASSASSPAADRPVTSVAFWDEIVAASGSDKIVRLWKRKSGKPAATLPAHNEPITSVALSPSYLIAVGGRTAVEIRPFGSPRGGIIDYPYEVLHTIKLKGVNDHTALNFSTDGKFLAVGNGGTFILWDTKTNQDVTTETNQDVTLAEGGDGFASVAFVDDNKSLITCDGQKLTRWDVATRRPTEIKLLVKDDKKPFIESLAFSLDSKTMVTNGNRSFLVWTAANEEGTAYKLKAELPAHKESILRRTVYNLVVALSPDGKLLATGDGTDLKNGGGVKLWDLSGEQPKELFTLSPDVADATSLSFSGDGRTLAVAARDAVQFWDVGPKEPFITLAEKSTLILASDQKSWLSVSPDSVSRYFDTPVAPEVRVWPLESFGNATANNNVANPGDKNIPIALANGGQLLATRQGRTLRLWDLSSDEPKLQATIEGDVGGKVAFSPDGKTIATASSIGIVEWWSTDQDQSRPMQSRGVDTSHVRAMAFSPDGKLLAVGGGSDEADSGLMSLWYTPFQQALPRSGAGHIGVQVDVTSLAFSPTDIQTLAVGGTDKTVELWDITGKLITHPLEGHRFPVTSVAYSPDGKTIASGDSGGVVNLWSASTYQWMLELKASSVSIQSVAFTADGSNMFTNDANGEIRLWYAAAPGRVAESTQSTAKASRRLGIDLFSFVPDMKPEARSNKERSAERRDGRAPDLIALIEKIFDGDESFKLAR
jgi:WD40 repeat protein/energy-coupling factor transporter ATP-binding protein EcfA2